MRVGRTVVENALTVTDMTPKIVRFPSDQEPNTCGYIVKLQQQRLCACVCVRARNARKYSGICGAVRPLY